MNEQRTQIDEASAAKHKLKREKQLSCDNNVLTQYDIKVLIQHSFHKKNSLVEKLLIASLFTGRSVKDLITSGVKTELLDNSDFGLLFSQLEFPNWNTLLSIDSSFPNVSQPPFVFLPICLIEAINVATGIDFESIKIEVKEVLEDLNRQNNSRLTHTRITHYLSAQSAKCGLSQAEVSFISNTSLRQHGGSSYLSMTASDLLAKHFLYINTLMVIACQPKFDVDDIDHHQIAQVQIGSNFSVPKTQIKSTINELKRTIEKEQRHQQHMGGNSWRLFNCYTYYTIILLNMCTGHRPNRGPYGTLRNFDLSRGVVFIADKMNREKSARIVPLNTVAIKQLQFYLTFLKEFISFIQFIHPDEASILQSAIDGREGLFNLWESNKLKPFSIQTLRKTDTPSFKAKSNWNRHFIRSVLATSIDLKPSAIDAFMGHENLLDESFSHFSALDMSEIRLVATALESEISEMEVKPLEIRL